MRWSFRRTKRRANARGGGSRIGRFRRGMKGKRSRYNRASGGVEAVEKSEPARGRVGANVDSNPSGGEPSTGRFISTRPAPSSFLHEHPRQSLCRSTFSPSSARGIKFGREAVSNILCSDSPTLSPLLHPSRSVSLTLPCSRSCVYARVCPLPPLPFVR